MYYYLRHPHCCKESDHAGDCICTLLEHRLGEHCRLAGAIQYTMYLILFTINLLAPILQVYNTLLHTTYRNAKIASSHQPSSPLVTPPHPRPSHPIHFNPNQTRPRRRLSHPIPINEQQSGSTHHSTPSRPFHYPFQYHHLPPHPRQPHHSHHSHHPTALSASSQDRHSLAS